MTDEDGHVSIEFRDRKKRLRVQRLAISDGNYADTYYVYDNYDELRYVIPPMASEQLAGPSSVGKEWIVSDKEISDWCYYYEYDIFGHVTVKKFPGSEKTVYRYNGNNRLTLSQNGEQRKSGSWTFYFYDHLVRLVLSGEISCMPSEAEDLLKESHVAEYAGGEKSPTMGYRIGTQALAEDYFSPDVAYFYDNYDFLPSVGGVERFAYREGLSDPRHHSAMGMQTGKCVSGDVTVSYYDGEGRVVQSHTSHGTDGMTSRYNKYTFTGQPLETLILHAGKSGSIREHYRYAYDSKGRQTDIWHSLNGGSEVRLCHTDYDELLRPKTIYIGAVPTEYTYDEEGRVVTATSPTFSMAAGYAEGGNYNGNISSETWDNGGEQRKYTYRYDGMNRLVSAKYDGTGKYGTEYRYDKNSNPTHIKRQGFMYSYNGNPLYGDIDDLTISYTGNHIKQVSDANNGLCHYGGLDFSKIAYGSDGDYRYNANGSLSYDPDRGISICYDRHNLPRLIKFDRGGEITYRNDGEGRRMEVTHRISSASASLAGKPVPTAAYKTVLKRKYIDHFVYCNDTLEYILTPTGYIDRDGNYYYYQKDSRGSVRTVLDGAGRVVERNDYYPYGMLMDGVSKSVQPYKFGGKELDRIGGINHYDFHARQLQLPIPHFYQQDPYADKYPHLSPYLYCAANPLRYVDPSGKDVAVIKAKGSPGHLAMLVQDGNRWFYYSYNGTNVYEQSSGSSGGKNYHDVGKKSFGDVMEFLKSPYNSSKSNYLNKEEAIQKDAISGYDFNEAYIIPTSRHQDKKIVETFIDNVHNDSYDLFINNCSQVVTESLQKGGVNVSRRFLPKKAMKEANEKLQGEYIKFEKQDEENKEQQ